MHRVIAYRGFEIDVQLTSTAEDMFDVTFQIKGGTNLEVLGARGSRIPSASRMTELSPITPAGPWSSIAAR